MKLYNLFTEKALMFKEKNAVYDGNNRISYIDLFEFSQQIKNSILAKQANNNEKAKPIALLFDHSINCIASLLGVLGTGNAYVPLEKSLPKDRIISILKDSKVNTILYESNTVDFLEKILGNDILYYSLINVDKLSKPLNKQDKNPEQITNNESSLFSILYTSGSTGIPKGVIQSEENVLFFVKQIVEKLQITDNDAVSLLTHYNHTVSIIDIFAALLVGAELKLYDIKAGGKQVKDFTDWVAKEKITVLHTVPSLFRYLTENQDKDAFASVEKLVLGGEQVLKSDFEIYKDYFSDSCKFINLFGSSEVLIATMKILEKKDNVVKSIIPIGKPYDGLEINLRDDNNNIGKNVEVGEIVYQSQYLTKGYNNLTTDSLEKINSKESVYYSGDYAKYLPDGDLLFLGRKDSQVKINGIRIELTDIEAAIEKNDKVDKCIVHSFNDDNNLNVICAYIITTDKSNIDETLIKQELKQQLPIYMIPSYFVQVEDFPRTDSGKMDRSKLIDPRKTNGDNENQENDQFNELEETILAIWQDVLKVEKIGLDDEFLKLGGDSLKMIMLSAKLKEFFGDDISDTIIFEQPTIRLLAQALELKYTQKISKTKG